MDNVNSSSVNAAWGHEKQKLQTALVKYAANLKSAERENSELREKLGRLEGQIAENNHESALPEDLRRGKEEIAEVLIEAKRIEARLIKAAEQRAADIVKEARRSVSEISRTVECISGEIKNAENRVAGLFRQLNAQTDLLKSVCEEKAGGVRQGEISQLRT